MRLQERGDVRASVSRVSAKVDKCRGARSSPSERRRTGTSRAGQGWRDHQVHREPEPRRRTSSRLGRHHRRWVVIDGPHPSALRAWSDPSRSTSTSTDSLLVRPAAGVGGGSREIPGPAGCDLAGARLRGEERVRREGKKNVHAYASGSRSPTSSVLDGTEQAVRYNPYELETFVVGNNQPLLTSRFAVFKLNDDEDHDVRQPAVHPGVRHQPVGERHER